MNNKNISVNDLKMRTKRFGTDVILFCDSLKKTKASSVVSFQLIKSATSAGANYRAACKGDSQVDFLRRLSTVTEETDKSVFWLEVINDTRLSANQKELERLLYEGTEILKIITKSKDTAYTERHFSLFKS